MAISTHAPLAGRDGQNGSADAIAARFQPTRPLRGATTLTPQQLDALKEISTHAPLAGRDAWGQAQIPQKTNFNPRAPCGARL